ncbi:MAG: DUF1761 domain-containing protein [Alphaproteobacteria bacterium]|nr:DUF1761 domain-containing protein [Alphaproteobacteria bacterium]
MQELANVNWLAVIVGTVVAFLVGWAWYSPKLFGKKWAEGSGVELGSADQMPVMAMVSNLLALFLLALVVGITATQDMLITAILAILACSVFVFSMGGYVKKSNYAMIVDLFYIVVAGIVMIICQGIF